MKTILTKKIDGYEIITGFGDALIDPEGTKKEILPLVAESEESKKLEELTKAMQGIARAREQARAERKEAHRNKDFKRRGSANLLFEQRQEEMEVMAEEYRGLAKAVKKKYDDLYQKKAVYFEPRPGESIAEESELAELQEKFYSLGKKQLLTINLEVIDDKRGTKYVKDGKVCAVSKIGEDVDGPLLADVTQEEFEAMRMSAMTEAELKAELEQVIETLAAQASTMRSKLEIQGDKDALKKAQGWYKTESAKAEAKYTKA